jgi:hypothetical protein
MALRNRETAGHVHVLMRLRLRTVALLGLVVASLTVGCSSAPDGDGATPLKEEDSSPSTTTPTLDPSLAGRMDTDKGAYAPGEEVRVRWPGEETRGIAYSLDAWTGTNWKTQFYMGAVTQGHRPPEGGPVWWETGEKDYGWVDIGVFGPGPDIAVVPDIADPGAYRLCTANSPKKSCVLITVEEAL